MKFFEIIMIMIMILVILVYFQKSYGDSDYVTSRLDNRKYLVQNLPDRQKAAEMLADINSDLIRLIRFIVSKYSNDPLHRDASLYLQKSYNPNTLCEGAPNSGYTSMTINKGEKLLLCIRQTDNAFVDKNVVMYVAVHELAHIFTFGETGHTDLFWSNFRLMLNDAIELGIYTKMNFANKHENYCGIKIKSSVV